MTRVPTSPTSGRAEPEVPAQLGRWRLGARLGEGGFAAVYRAVDPDGRRAAIKLLPRPAGDELRALARVCHPGVVALLGAGASPRPWLAMALAPGRPARDDGAWPAERVVRVLARAADALAACHDAGVVHGDVKPANLLVDEDRVCFVDFGLTGAMGGTAAYAAPEVLSGQRAGAEADVYGLGLVAYELAVGHAAWADLPPTERLLARQVGRPPLPSHLPDVLRELLSGMLTVDPSARPAAAWIADRLESEGVPLFAPSPADLERRARTLHVDRGPAEARVDQWLTSGGAVAITGPRGSGRTALLERAANERLARGQTAWWIRPAAGPWGAIRTALADPDLPGSPVDLPERAETGERAEAAARALAARLDGAAVFVDDWDAHDAGARLVLEELARLGVAVLVAGEGAPAWGERVTPLEPLAADGVRELAERLLGGADPELVEWLLRGGRWPAAVLRSIAAAMEAGALTWRRRRWVPSPEALDRIRPAADGAIALPPLPPDGLRLAAVVARGQPIETAEALAIAGATEETVDDLVARGLVRGGGTLSLVSPELAPLHLERAPDRVGLDRALRDRWLAGDPVPYARLGAVLLGAGDRDPIAVHGAACVLAVSHLDVPQAVALADAVWAVCPTATVAAARVEVLVRAGRAEDARAAGRAWLAEHPHDRHAAPVLLALARLEDQVSENPAAILAQTALAATALADGPPSPELALIEARALFRASRLDEADHVCAPLCEGPPGHDVALWLGACTLLAQVRHALGGARAGLEVLTRVPPTLGGGTAERAVLDATRGRLLWHLGRVRDAAAALEDASAARSAVSLVDRARFKNNAALCWYSAGDVERAVGGWESALLGFERIGARIEQIRVLVNLTQGYADLGRWRRAEEAGEAAVALARAHDAPAFVPVALGNLGECALWQGQLAEAEARFAEAARVGEAAGEPPAAGEAAVRRAKLALLRADPDRRARAEAAVTLADGAVERAGAEALLAWACALDGGRRDFTTHADAALAPLRDEGAAVPLAVARLAVAEGWLALGEPHAAAQEATAAERYAEESGRPPLRQWASRILAQTRHAGDGAGKLELLTQLAVRVARHTDLDVLLHEVATALVDLTDAERAAVLLLENGVPRVAAEAGVQVERPLSMTLVDRALSLRREVVVSDLEERSDLRDATSVVALELRAVLCMPLVVDDVLVGVVYLDSREQAAGRLRETVTLVRALTAHVCIALRNARLAAALRTSVDLAREVAHDLRNPLNVVLTIARDGSAGGVEPEDLRLVVDAAEHAVELLRRTLEGAGEVSVPLSLSAAVASWLAPIRRQAEAHRVAIVDQLDAEGEVRAHPDELRRVLGNLLGNALKYTPHAGRIMVRTVDHDAWVHLEVTDSGPGFPAEGLESVFVRGWQGPGARAGSGLGLAIVRRIVEAHGGDVHAANAPGAGAQIIVRLPRVAPRE